MAEAEAEPIERDATGGDAGVKPGARILAVDPRSGIEVLGRVDDVTDDGIRVNPIGNGYPPGGFSVGAEGIEEVVGAADEQVDDYEQRRREEWDIVCMCLSGALRKLDSHAVTMVSTSIAEGHL